MTPDPLERIFRDERPKALATLIRLLGDFDLAEEALQEAFLTAVERWGAAGLPDNPSAWLVATGRNRALDRLRRRTWWDEHEGRIAAEHRQVELPAEPADRPPIEDDRLRLIFTCCHPALAAEAQVALTLRTLCGLGTEEIARAFLVPVPTLAQRLVRAKKKIRDAGIPYRLPGEAELPERLGAVLAVIYLIFNEGYAATAGPSYLRADLVEEAIRLTRLLSELLPGHPDVEALLALMLLHDARRPARLGPDGGLVRLDEQDRARWHRGRIEEGLARVGRALPRAGASRFGLEAAIAALHAEAATAAETDWPQILALYDLLRERHPSPVVELNRAVAVAMVQGPEAALAVLDGLESSGQLGCYHLLPAAKADLLVRLGRSEEARTAYREALELATHETERTFLERQLGRVARD